MSSVSFSISVLDLRDVRETDTTEECLTARSSGTKTPENSEASCLVKGFMNWNIEGIITALKSRPVVSGGELRGASGLLFGVEI